jgi:2-polyprenyl-6-methoxyphenol hydroxylase-like FAD-dependent oxidoreductase
MYDAIIVGARCAGSALGLLLARRGYRVLLVDRATFPSDMPMSTHFVHQRGVACLARWGLREQVVATKSPPVSRFAIDVGPFTLTGTAPPVDGESYAFAPHRLLLDDLLVQAAIQSGAEFREGCPVEQLLFEDGQVTGGRAATPRGTPFLESARLVVGADGPASRVAAAVQAAEHHAQPAQQGSAWIYWQDVPLMGAEIYLRDFEGVYAFPSSKGTVVGANWAMDRFRTARRDIDASYLALLHRVAPQLAERVAHARRADERLYLGSTRNFFRTAHGPGWVLLGDAHYKKDFCTAQGITDAFCDAEPWPTPSRRGSQASVLWRTPWQRMPGRVWSGRCRFTNSPAKWPRLPPCRLTCWLSIKPWQRTMLIRAWVNAILTGSLRACSPQYK